MGRKKDTKTGLFINTSDRPLVKKTFMIEEEHEEKLRSLLKDGETFSDKVREAIAVYLGEQNNHIGGSPIKINLNQKVRVKLTDIGKTHLANRHVNIEGKRISLSRWVTEDEQGYSIWQIWDLMGVFGELMQYPTMHVPFEPTIELILD